MERHELEFRLTYSILLEQMQSVLLGRADRFCTFSQLFLGTAVATDFINPVVSGMFVAALAAFQITFQPGAKSAEAKLQRGRYLELSKRAPKLSKEQLHEEITTIENSDSEPLGSLTHPAWLATSLQENLPIDDMQWHRMTRLEAFLATLAGNLPKKFPK